MKPTLTCRIHPDFTRVFEEEELEEIFNRACIVAHDCLVLFNEKYFFELSVEDDEGLRICCGRHDGTEGRIEYLDKEDFLERLRAWPAIEILTYDVS